MDETDSSSSSFCWEKNKEECDTASVCSESKFSVASADTAVVLPRGSRSDNEFVQVRVRNKRTGTVDILKVKKGTDIRKLLQDYTKSQQEAKYKIVKVSKTAVEESNATSPPNRRYSRIGSDVWISKPLKQHGSGRLFLLLFAGFFFFLLNNSKYYLVTPNTNRTEIIQAQNHQTHKNETKIRESLLHEESRQLATMAKRAHQEALLTLALAVASSQKNIRNESINDENYSYPSKASFVANKSAQNDNFVAGFKMHIRTILRESVLVLCALAFGRFMPPARLVRVAPATFAATSGLAAATFGRTAFFKRAFTSLATSFSRFISPTITKCVVFLLPKNIKEYSHGRTANVASPSHQELDLDSFPPHSTKKTTSF